VHSFLFISSLSLLDCARVGYHSNSVSSVVFVETANSYSVECLYSCFFVPKANTLGIFYWILRLAQRLAFLAFENSCFFLVVFCSKVKKVVLKRNVCLVFISWKPLTFINVLICTRY
jgi:hypothetical protein